MKTSILILSLFALASTTGFLIDHAHEREDRKRIEVLEERMSGQDWQLTRLGKHSAVDEETLARPGGGATNMGSANR